METLSTRLESREFTNLTDISFSKTLHKFAPLCFNYQNLVKEHLGHHFILCDVSVLKILIANSYDLRIRIIDQSESISIATIVACVVAVHVFCKVLCGFKG